MKTVISAALLLPLLLTFSCEKKYVTTPQQNPPETVTLLSPEDGAANISLTPTFAWSASSGATAYRLQLAYTASFDSTLFDIGDIEGISYEATGLEMDAAYFWRVRAINAVGSSDWSAAWSFSTVIDSAARIPSAPILVSPEPEVVVSPEVEIVWRTSPGADAYQLQVASSILFVSIVYEQSDIGDTTVSITLAEGDTYYWRARASNAFGTSNWSVLRSFTTATSAAFSVLFGGADYDYGRSIATTADGGYVLLGHTQSYGAGGADLWLLKTNRFGMQEWAHTFGGAANEESRSVVKTGDGGYLLCGITETFAGAVQDIWLVKTDVTGALEWQQNFGGSGENDAGSVVICADGGYIVAGSRTFDTASKKDFWLLKTDAAGALLWEKAYGGGEHEVARAVIQTDDGGCILAGYTESFGAGGQDIWLLKTDAEGDSLWDATYGSTGNEMGYSVVQTADGGFAIAGIALDNVSQDFDALLVKTDANGVAQWTKTFGGADTDIAFSAEQTFDGGFILTGSTRSSGLGGENVWLIKTDASGGLLWEKTYGGNGDDRAYEVRNTDDGGYAVIGNTHSYGAGGTDLWMLKTDANGSIPGNTLR